jgi:hypothetical protein
MKIISDKDLAVYVGGAGKVLIAGEPREVSEVVGLAALQLGAKIYNENSVTPQEIEDAEFEEVVEETTEEFDPALMECLANLIEQGNPEDFKVDGTPKAAIINKAVGRTVRSDEREAAWEAALNL